MDLVARSTGVPLAPGNLFRVLQDAEGNYPAWEAAIAAARRTIHLEMYIVHADRTGVRFRDLLAERARAGVRVRVLCDWFGCLNLSFRRFWRPVTQAGGEVRYANGPPGDSLVSLASRDHRKLIVVDGEVAYVSGLCMGDAWRGDPARGVAPWRDTGTEIKGPAVADAQAAFAAAWERWGSPLEPDERVAREDLPMVGPVSVAVVGTIPERAPLYRLDLVVASLARERLWLTDAYFLATATYLEALVTAARSGVDVRLLVPGNSDVGWVANVSRTMYRRLLEAGVRVFEWNGTMIHSKTAVADGQLVRIGSTNLNLQSWIGNWELDAIVSDERVGGEMDEQFLEDLHNSTEIVLTERHRVRLSHPRERARRPRKQRIRSSAGRMMADLGFVKTTLGAAVKGHRVLGPGEDLPLVVAGIVAVGLAVLFFYFPGVAAWPLIVLLGVEGTILAIKGLRLKRRFGRPPADRADRPAAEPSHSTDGGSRDASGKSARHAAPDA